MFGVNILAQSLEDRNRMIDFVVRLKPNAIVVMDDVKLALGLSNHPDLQGTTIVYRAYAQQDATWHLTNSAEEIWNWHKANSHKDLVTQVWNEPSGYVNTDVFASKAAEVIRLASLDGWRVALPMWAVEHPDLEQVSKGVFDTIIKALYDHQEHLFGVHEYARVLPSSEVKDGRILRFKSFLNRAAEIGCRLAPSRIVIAEFGRDYMGRYGDGYRENLSSEAYADFHRDAAMVYAEHGVDKVATFCVGKGGGNRWEKFNLEGDTIVQDAMVDINRTTQVLQPAVEPPVGAPENQVMGVVITTAARVNVRTAPSITADATATVINGQLVSYLNNTVARDDLGRAWWVLVNPSGYMACWAANIQRLFEGSGYVAELRETSAALSESIAEASALSDRIKTMLDTVK